MRKARVLLLNPPTAAVSTEILLNLAYLAAVLRKEGHEVIITDATAPYKLFTEDQINKVIAEFKPDFIGITLTITYIPQTYEYIKRLRRLGIPIVAGGPHANCLPEEVLNNGVDITAIGEGEITIVELAEHFAGNRPLSDISSLAFKENGNIKYTSGRQLIKDLDSIPFPDFGDFPIKNYTGSSDVNSNPIFWSIFSSRGCPFNCTFCSSHSVFGRTIRFRSAKNMVEEIKGLVERFGINKVAFQDDEILCNKRRFLEFCDLIEDARLGIKMSIRTRISSIDKEILCRAKDIGLTRMSFGIESWNNETLKKVNKKYVVNTIHEKFRLLEEAEFPYISFNNIWGFPWETKDHIKKNIEEISKTNMPFFTTVLHPIPFPGTKLYEEFHEQYGFSNWWLDPDKHDLSLIEPGAADPFFLKFASMYLPLHLRDVYWNYSRQMKRTIRHGCWKLFRMSLRRQFKYTTYLYVYSLTRLSFSLWNISPKLEQAFFKHLVLRIFGKKIERSRKAFKFVDKY